MKLDRLTRPRPTIFAAAAIWGLPLLAYAHHGEGMQTPNSLGSAAIGGLLHPVLDLPHLLFLLALGTVCWTSRRVGTVAGVFLVGTVAGALLHWLGAELPQLTLLLALTLWGVAGLLLLRRRQVPVVASLLLIAAASLIHGGGYAESIEGASLVVLLVYLLAVTVAQAALIAVVVRAGARLGLLERWSRLWVLVVAAGSAGGGLIALVTR